VPLLDEVICIKGFYLPQLKSIRQGMAQKLTTFNFCDKLVGKTHTRARSILRSAVIFRNEVILYNEVKAIEEGKMLFK